jgi:hypothetical protein
MMNLHSSVDGEGGTEMLGRGPFDAASADVAARPAVGAAAAAPARRTAARR